MVSNEEKIEENRGNSKKQSRKMFKYFLESQVGFAFLITDFRAIIYQYGSKFGFIKRRKNCLLMIVFHCFIRFIFVNHYLII